MKPAITLFLICLFFCSHAQKKKSDVTVFEEQTDSGVNIYGSNNELVPYTVELEISQKNLKSDKKFPLKVVLPAGAERQLIAELVQVKKNKGWSFGSRSTYYMGDFQAKHDDSYAYQLPFEAGNQFLMSQGYNGNFSHQGKNAIDFTMPVGTSVLAARSGIVIDVKEDSNRGCAKRSCLDFANKITILHDDGSMAEYVHLKKKGALVKRGEQVQAGQKIGLSGDTGFSSGPHLHFQVFLAGKNEAKTLKTVFETRPGKVEPLKENKVYEAF